MGAENKRRGGESIARGQEGQEALLPLSWATGVTLPKSYIYWEINTPRGVLLQTSQKTQRGRGSCGLGRSTDPEPFLEHKTEENAQAAVPFDFKGKLEKGNSKSLSPKKVRFTHDKKDRASQVSVTWALRAACILGN